MSSGLTSHSPTYYEILQLRQSPAPQPLAKEDVKAAYHRALLLHHPDKAAKNATATASTLAPTRASSDSPSPSPSISISISVDIIVAAYETLSSPTKRRAYDAALAAGRQGNGPTSTCTVAKGTHPGVETFDLEDLAFADKTNTWQHACRCGNEEGYVLSEEELERESGRGEIYVGCRGCSLFIKVVFAVNEEEEEEEEEEEVVVVVEDTAQSRLDMTCTEA